MYSTGRCTPRVCCRVNQPNTSGIVASLFSMSRPSASSTAKTARHSRCAFGNLARSSMHVGHEPSTYPKYASAPGGRLETEMSSSILTASRLPPDVGAALPPPATQEHPEGTGRGEQEGVHCDTPS